MSGPCRRPVGTAYVRIMMSGKIHRATITGANVDYEGSITIDPDLLEAAGILAYEQVHVLDVTNGARLETYTILGERGSGEVCVNGAAAHLVREGDLAIIVAYQHVTEDEARRLRPHVVFVDGRNRPVITFLGDGHSHTQGVATAAVGAAS